MNFLTLFQVPIALFFIGLFGIFTNRKNTILIIVCIELLLLAVNFIFLIGSFYLDDIFGQVFAIFVVTIAAAESSIGLAILVVYYRLRGTISILSVQTLRN